MCFSLLKDDDSDINQITLLRNSFLSFPPPPTAAATFIFVGRAKLVHNSSAASAQKIMPPLNGITGTENRGCCLSGMKLLRCLKEGTFFRRALKNSGGKLRWTQFGAGAVSLSIL